MRGPLVRRPVRLGAGAAPGAAPLRVLHVSDLHLAPYQHRKVAWVRSLQSLEPDLVVDTGDNIAHRDAVPVLLDALGSLTERPGLFVLGSNDCFEPSLRNPVGYLLPDDGKRKTHTPHLPWRSMVDQLTSRGWTNLTNTRASLEVAGTRIAAAGLDDPTWSTTTSTRSPGRPTSRPTSGWG